MCVRSSVRAALRNFKHTGDLKGTWDHQPLVDATQQYMRNHMDLDDLERRARYPQVTS